MRNAAILGVAALHLGEQTVGTSIETVIAARGKDIGAVPNVTGMPRIASRSKESANGDDIDLFGLYLQEIGRYPLLTKQDEIDLAKCIRAGVKARQRLEAPEELAKTEQYELEQIAREGLVAKETFIQSNLRLVVSIAKRYKNRGVEVHDMIAEGNFGLNRAVEKFDPDKGFKFSTYATWWIRQAITRSLANTGHTIRIPSGMTEKIYPLDKARERLQQVLGREPSFREIAAECYMLEEEAEKLLQFARIRNVGSLDAPINSGEHSEATLQNFISDEKTEDDHNALLNNIVVSPKLEELLNLLDDRERYIVSQRNGLYDGRVHTLEELGAEMGITRERIRQIQEKAMARLKKNAKGMLDFSDLEL